MDYEQQRGSDAELGMPAAESSESALMSDAGETTPQPPESPAVDLQAIAPPDDDGTLDAGDDSDAPVELGAAITGSEQVSLSQSGVQSIDAATVTLSQSGAGQVRADTMSVEQSGVGVARVGTLTMGSGASALAVIADTATVQEGSTAFVVVSRSLRGDARPTVDWRGALAFGAGLGLAISILRRIR